MSLEDSLLFPKFYGETSNVSFNQILLLKQFANEVLRKLHGDLGESRVITKSKSLIDKKLLHIHGTISQDVVCAKHQRIMIR